MHDFEYFDINIFSKGWTTINYINNRGYNIGLTVLGVVPISKNIFLICGGFDEKNINLLYIKLIVLIMSIQL